MCVMLWVLQIRKLRAYCSPFPIGYILESRHRGIRGGLELSTVV